MVYHSGIATAKRPGIRQEALNDIGAALLHLHEMLAKHHIGKPIGIVLDRRDLIPIRALDLGIDGSLHHATRPALNGIKFYTKHDVEDADEISRFRAYYKMAIEHGRLQRRGEKHVTEYGEYPSCYGEYREHADADQT